MHSRPSPFQQRTNTSCYLAIPTHGFTVVLSVFRGTPPAKPLDCKIRLNSSGALCRDPWADPTGGEPRLSRAIFCFVPGDIIKTSVSFYSQLCLSLSSLLQSCMGNKKPCFHFGKQGLRKSLTGSFTCSPFYPDWLRAFARYMPRIVQGGTRSPGSARYDVSRTAGRPSPAKSRLICSCKFSSNARNTYHK